MGGHESLRSRKNWEKVIEWIKDLQAQGVGEILITSVDMDGLCKGIDNDLIEACSKVCKIPLLVGGGFGHDTEVNKVIINPKISGVSIGASFHKEKLSIKNLKNKIKENNSNFN